MNRLVKAARAADVPAGGGHIVQVEGREIAVFRIGNTYHAVDNVCPHRGGPLAHGPIEGGTVICPWHGWQFDLATGALVMNPDTKLAVFKVVEKGGDIFLEMPARP